MSSLTMNSDLVHLGMDTSKDSIVVGILRSDEWDTGLAPTVVIPHGVVDPVRCTPESTRGRRC